MLSLRIFLRPPSEDFQPVIFFYRQKKKHLHPVNFYENLRKTMWVKWIDIIFSQKLF